MGRKRIKPLIEGPCYTEKQRRFLNGEITPDEVDGRFYKFLIQKAIELNDEDTAEIAKGLLEYSKEEVKKRNLERTKIRKQKLKNGIPIEYKQPKSAEYTEHQKMIVRDEIPIEKVHTNELVSIMKKAKTLGDTELENLMETIIKERQDDSLENQRNKFKKFKEAYKANRKNHIYVSRNNSNLTKNELEILQTRNVEYNCSLELLYHIRDIAIKTNDEENLKLAELFIQYKLHPEIVYRTQDKNEAMENIQRILGIPIRRPKDWFT